MNIFDINSPFVKFLGRMADMMWLNLLTLVCCIPIVTVGASLTALNYMSIKIVRGEDCYITKGFFKAFKENFRQSTVIWLIFLFVLVVLGGDYYIFRKTDLEMSKIIKALIIAIGIMALFTFMFVFPLQAKFANPVMKTIRNAFGVSILQFPRTVAMIIFYLFPYGLLLISNNMVPFVFLFGLSVPALASAMLYNKFFLKLEAQIRAENGEPENPDEDERIFHDELDT